ncbi:hypothetical protein NX059_011347 [Plenodomus lindquistii]|nr:hypothetical protein NX059_011347 [Plenodomus lindquistii]
MKEAILSASMAADGVARTGGDWSIPISKTFAEAATHLRQLDHFGILEYCLGFDKPGLPKMTDNFTLVSMHVEHDRMRPTLWSEVGFSILHRKEAKKHVVTPGDHSENLMKCAYFRHIRVEENMRYLNIRGQAKDLHNRHNRFGETRFTSELEAKAILLDALSGRPVVMLTFQEGCNRHDLPEFLQLPPNALDCVVATISTQRIARERGIDWRTDKRTDLGVICKSLGFRCDDLDGASNYAGFNLVAAIQMAMRWRFEPSKIPLQTKINELQIESQCRYVPWGSKQFCFMCGSNGHSPFNVHGQPTCDMDWEAECDRCWAVDKDVEHSGRMCPYS